MNMKKVNTKTVKVKERRDFSKGGTPQERHMENVERGYTSSVTTMRVTGETVIDGKRYITLTV